MQFTVPQAFSEGLFYPVTPLTTSWEQPRHKYPCRGIDLDHLSMLRSVAEADGSWWVPRTSNPVWGATSVSGGFDSHALPPILYYFIVCYILILVPHPFHIIISLFNEHGTCDLSQRSTTRVNRCSGLLCLFTNQLHLRI